MIPAETTSSAPSQVARLHLLLAELLPLAEAYLNENIAPRSAGIAVATARRLLGVDSDHPE